MNPTNQHQNQSRNNLTRQYLLDQVTDGLSQQFKGAEGMSTPLTLNDLPQAEQAIHQAIENVRAQVGGGGTTR